MHQSKKLLKVLQTQPSALAEKHVVALHDILGIIHPGTGRVLPKVIVQFVLRMRRRLLLWEIIVLQGKQRKMLVWVRDSQREE